MSLSLSPINHPVAGSDGIAGRQEKRGMQAARSSLSIPWENKVSLLLYKIPSTGKKGEREGEKVCVWGDVWEGGEGVCMLWEK